MAYSIFIRVTLLLSLFPFSSAVLNCSGTYYNVTMLDSYGDGWSGDNPLVIDSCEGEELLNEYINDGYQEFAEFCVPNDGLDGAFVYTCECIVATCDFSSEISWFIYDINGNQVLTGDGFTEQATYGSCNTKAPTSVPTPCPASVSSALMFSPINNVYVAEDEAANLDTILIGLCLDLTYTDVPWVSGSLDLSGYDVFVVPELGGDTSWATTLSAADVAELYSFVSNGGSLIIIGNSNLKPYDAALLSKVFDLNITHATNAQCATDSSVNVADTWGDYRPVFASAAAPSSLSYATLIHCLDVDTLPASAVSAYGTTTYSWLTWIPLDSGSINYIAFDFDDVSGAETAGTLDEWVKVLSLSMVSQETNAPTTSPTPLPTLVPTHSVVPSPLPTPQPTFPPSPQPSQIPTSLPTSGPTIVPSSIPTYLPTLKPSPLPSPVPTPQPTPSPTPGPSPAPTGAPSHPPTPLPSPVPSHPTMIPTPSPTFLPSNSINPTFAPSLSPTPKPSPSPTSFDHVSTIVSMDIGVSSESDITASVLTSTLSNELSSIGVTASNLMEFEYISWTASRRLNTATIAATAESQDEDVRRRLSGVATVSMAVAIDLSDTDYTSAGDLEAAITSILTNALNDGSLAIQLSSDCSCTVSSVSVSTAHAHPYPTKHPTPVPSPAPTECSVQPFTVTRPSGGQSYTTGDTIPVSWTYRACTGSFVDIFLCAYESGGGSTCYGGVNSSYTNIARRGYEANNGNFSLVITANLPFGSGDGYFIKIVDDLDSSLTGSSADLSYILSPSAVPTPAPFPVPSASPITPPPTTAGNKGGGKGTDLNVVGAGAAFGLLLLGVVACIMVRACKGGKDSREDRDDEWTNTANNALSTDQLTSNAIEITRRRMSESEVPETAIAVAGEWVEDGADSEIPVAALVSEMSDEELVRVAHGKGGNYTDKEKKDAIRRLSKSTKKNSGNFGSFSKSPRSPMSAEDDLVGTGSPLNSFDNNFEDDYDNDDDGAEGGGGGGKGSARKSKGFSSMMKDRKELEKRKEKEFSKNKQKDKSVTTKTKKSAPEKNKKNKKKSAATSNTPTTYLDSQSRLNGTEDAEGNLSI